LTTREILLADIWIVDVVAPPQILFCKNSSPVSLADDVLHGFEK